MNPSAMLNQYDTIHKIILPELIKKVKDSLRQRELDLIPRHVQLGGSQDGYIYMGVAYTHLTGRYASLGKYDQLKPELVPEIIQIQIERQQLMNDYKKMAQALMLALRGCYEYQDFRDALPEGLHEFVESLKSLPRTRPEAWTLEGDERATRQYRKLRDKIDYYLATQLIY